MNAPADRSPLASLSDEHSLITRAANAFEEYASRFETGRDADRADLARFAEFFADFAELVHHVKEEDILLSVMAQHGFAWDSGPVADVRKEHEQEQYLVRVLRQAAAQQGGWTLEDQRHALVSIRAFIDFQRAHMDKEEAILYPAAVERLSSDDLAELSRRLDEFDAKHDSDELRRTRALAESLIGRYGSAA